METGEFRDPIAERAAQDQASDAAEDAPQEEATSEDDIAFDDL